MDPPKRKSPPVDLAAEFQKSRAWYEREMAVSPWAIIGWALAIVSGLAFVVAVLTSIGTPEHDSGWFTVPLIGMAIGLLLIGLAAIWEIRREIRRLRDDNSQR